MIPKIAHRVANQLAGNNFKAFNHHYDEVTKVLKDHAASNPLPKGAGLLTSLDHFKEPLDALSKKHGFVYRGGLHADSHSSVKRGIESGKIDNHGNALPPEYHKKISENQKFLSLIESVNNVVCKKNITENVEPGHPAEDTPSEDRHPGANASDHDKIIHHVASLATNGIQNRSGVFDKIADRAVRAGGDGVAAYNNAWLRVHDGFENHLRTHAEKNGQFENISDAITAAHPLMLDHVRSYASELPNKEKYTGIRGSWGHQTDRYPGEWTGDNQGALNAYHEDEANLAWDNEYK